MQKGIDYIGVSVVYFCHDGKGNFVMGKRSQNARDEHGKWDPGAGAVELNDTVENTLRKETKEEYCADIIEFEFLGYRDVHRENNGQKTHWVGLDFKILVDHNQVKNGEPHKFEEVKWFSKNDMPPAGDCHSQWGLFLEKYHDRLWN